MRLVAAGKVQEIIRWAGDCAALDTPGDGSTSYALMMGETAFKEMLAQEGDELSYQYWIEPDPGIRIWPVRVGAMPHNHMALMAFDEADDD